VITLLVMLVLVVGCGDDPARPGNTTTSPYEDRSEEWHVVHNIQQAYNDMNPGAFAQQLDPDHFVFYFYDVVGGDTPESWGYDEETASATNMFTGAGGEYDNPIRSITLTFLGVEAADWQDTQDADFPGEVLRQATVGYRYYMDTEADVIYNTAGAPKAHFIVHKAHGKWELVKWYELDVEPGLKTSPSWGQIKYLYRESTE
jgi:hypothetical protein